MMQIVDYNPNMEIVISTGKVGLTECNQLEILRWFKLNRPNLWQKAGEQG